MENTTKKYRISESELFNCATCPELEAALAFSF